MRSTTKLRVNKIMFTLCNTKQHKLRPIIGKPLYKLAQWMYRKGW